MSLEAIKYNREVVRQLKNVISEGTVSHAYLFVGEASVRRELGIEFVKSILCKDSLGDNCGKCVLCTKIDHGNHEDVIFIDKEGNSVKTEAIERLIASISFKSIGARTVVMMDNADAMTVIAQNKLLKTLEEPAGNAVIILLAERKHALKDTVISRCVSFDLQESKSIPDTHLSVLALAFIKLCVYEGAYYKKISTLEEIFSDRTVCLDFLDVLEEKFRALLLIKAGASTLLSEMDENTRAFFEALPYVDASFIQRAVTAIEDARKAIQQSFNISYALKLLCLRLDNRRLMEE